MLFRGFFENFNRASGAVGVRDFLRFCAMFAALQPCHGDHARSDDGTHGKTPLMRAVQVGGSDAHAAVVALLMAGSFDVNRRDGKGRTALMLAARRGSSAVLQLLIEAGADLELRCGRGQTAWSKAQGGGHRGAAALLVAAGARQPHGAEAPFPSVSFPSAARFARQYRGQMTVVLRGLVRSWPACAAW